MKSPTELFDQTCANIFELARVAFPPSPAAFLMGLGTGRLLREGVSEQEIRSVFENSLRAAVLVATSKPFPPQKDPPS